MRKRQIALLIGMIGFVLVGCQKQSVEPASIISSEETQERSLEETLEAVLESGAEEETETESVTDPSIMTDNFEEDWQETGKGKRFFFYEDRYFTFTVDADSIIAKEKADTGHNIQVGSVWIAKVSGGTLIPVTVSPYEDYSTIEIRSTNNGGYSLEGIDIQDNTTYGIMVEISGAPGESYNLSGCYASYFRITSSGSAAGGVVSYSWLSDGKGWWVQGSDGTYLINQWYQDPATNLYYYMGPDGYMLTNSTTPDGYYVNGDGVWVESSSLQTAGREKQAVYDSEHGSFLEKKQVIYNYLEAIGYDTNGLTIKEGNIHYTSFSSGEESLYDLLAYDSQAVFNEISYYTNFGGNADKLIQAVENYLSQK